MKIVTIWEKSRITLPFTFKDNPRGRKSQEQTENAIEGTKFCGISVEVRKALWGNRKYFLEEAMTKTSQLTRLFRWC